MTDFHITMLTEALKLADKPERDAHGWWPIETAPTDGSFVFLYWPTMSITSFPQVGFHHGDEYGWELTNDRDYGEVFPTHWRDMFPPPVQP